MWTVFTFMHKLNLTMWVCAAAAAIISFEPLLSTFSQIKPNSKQKAVMNKVFPKDVLPEMGLDWIGSVPFLGSFLLAQVAKQTTHSYSIPNEAAAD